MNPRAIRHTVFVLDLVFIALSAVTAYMLRTDSPWHAARLRIALNESWFVMSAAGATWLLVFHRLKLDGFYGGYETSAMLTKLFTGTVALVLLVASACFLLHQNRSRLLLASFAGLFFVAAFAGRLGAHWLFRRFAGHPNRRRVLIVGKGRIARELAERIARHPEMGWQLVGFLFPSADDLVVPVFDRERSRRLNSLNIDGLLKEQAIDELMLATPVPDKGEMLNLVANCRQRGLRVTVIPNLYQLYVNRPALVDLDGLPLLHFAEGRLSPLELAQKRVFDLTISFVLLVGGSPLLILSGLLLRMRRGKALCSETRCGRDGQPFRMLRFNSRRDASDASGLERLLEKLGIAELPKLFNVLKGDMSLVGPQPETEERVKRYSDWQRQRLVCKPGLTGLAQVQGLGEENSSDDKTYFDLRYIQDWSLLTDIALMLETMWTLPRRLGATRTRVAKSSELDTLSESKQFPELVHADRP